MKAVLQRVKGACVHVDGKLVSSIGPGIVALIGIGSDDTADDIVPLCSKMLSLKLWNEGQKAAAIPTPPQYIFDQERGSEGQTGAAAAADAATTTTATTAPASSRAEEVWGGKPWRSSVVEIGGEILCVSQFTLHARTVKGAKPDFHKSMGGADAQKIYNALLQRLKETGFKERPEAVKDGAFGEMMDLSLTNDGPVTILLDTTDKR